MYPNAHGPRHTAPPGVQLSQMPGGRSAEGGLPDVWEYHQRRSNIEPPILRASIQRDDPLVRKAKTTGCQVGSEARTLHPATTSKGIPVLLVSLMLAMSLFLLRSSTWQEETMAARPDEVYKVYATMMSMMPEGGEGAQIPSRALSSKPQPIFDLTAGIFTAYVVGICKPGEHFEYMVDSKSCGAKLEAFCMSLRDATPNDPYLQLGERLYENCMETAEKQNGLSLSLLYGPVRQLWSHDPSNLEEEFQTPLHDWSSEFCTTVADCDQLVLLRSWTWGLTSLLLLGLGSLIACSVASAMHWLKPEVELKKTRVIGGLLSLVSFIVAVALYLYIAKTFPVSSYIRSESLFYFMLPEPHSTRRLDEEVFALAPRQLAESDMTGPLAKRWKGLLLSLTGALLRGLAKGDMSSVYLELQESLERGWRLADALFQRWLKYMRYALSQAPSDGAMIFRDTGKRLQELDEEIFQLIPNETNSTEEKLLRDLGMEFHGELQEVMMVNEKAKTLVEHSQALIQSILRAWQDLQQPIYHLVDRIKRAIGKNGKVMQRVLEAAKNLALDKSTVDDLKIIFKRLFQTLPKVLKGVRVMASDFHSLTKSFGPLVKQTRKTMHRSSKSVRSLMELQKDAWFCLLGDLFLFGLLE